MFKLPISHIRLMRVGHDVSWMTESDCARFQQTLRHGRQALKRRLPQGAASLVSAMNLRLQATEFRTLPIASRMAPMSASVAISGGATIKVSMVTRT